MARLPHSRRPPQDELWFMCELWGIFYGNIKTTEMSPASLIQLPLKIDPHSRSTIKWQELTKTHCYVAIFSNISLLEIEENLAKKTEDYFNWRTRHASDLEKGWRASWRADGETITYAVVYIIKLNTNKLYGSQRFWMFHMLLSGPYLSWPCTYGACVLMYTP